MANPTKYFRNYDYVCRYQGFPYYYDSRNNRYYYGLTSYLSDNTDYVVYEVKPGDSYDSIALDKYGCALYYWIILDYNRILDALEPPVPGTILRLPSLNSIIFDTTGG